MIRPNQAMPFWSASVRVAARFAHATFLLILASNTASALDPHKKISQYGLESWQARRGVANGGILCIAQSADGYLWLGTRRGLVRFNGIEFQLFDRASSGGLIGWNVYHIEPLPDGGILFSTEGGAGLVEYRNGKFSAFQTPTLPTANIRVFHRSPDGTLWIGTTGPGLFRISNRQLNVYSAAEGAGANIKAIVNTRDGSTWIATYGNGVARFSGGKFTRYGMKEGLPSNDVRAILEDPDGTLWFSTLAGLVRLRSGEFTTFSHQDGLSNDRPFPLLRDGGGNLWIGTEGGGLNRMTDGQFSFLTTKEGLTTDEVRSVFEDREGNLWFGGADGALYRLRDEKFTVFTRHEGLSSDLIRAVFEDREGSIWVGTSLGVNQLRQGRIVKPRESWARGTVTTIIQDHDGGFWIGTLGEGLRWIHDGRTQLFFQDRRITALFEDREGSIWAGISPGLVRIRNGKPTAVGEGTSLAQSRIVAFSQDKSRAVWAVEVSGTLHRMDPSGVVADSSPSGACAAGVTSLHLDEAGALWIGTADGLCRYLEGTFEHYSIEEGLAESQVNSILDDGRGYLWLSGYEGFSRISKSALTKYRRGAGSKLPVWFVEHANGKATSSGFQMPSAMKAKDGRLWFASLRGLIMIDPATARPDPKPVPAVIEEVLVDRAPLRLPLVLQEAPKLAATVRDIEFRFVGLSLGDPAGVQFRYQLEGYDTDWNEAGNRREAFYTNLPSGPFRFRVMAANGDGVWNTQDASIAFVKDAHIYETVWMRLVVLAALGVACWLVYRTRVAGLSKRFEAVLAERNRIARELHDTVEQGLTGIILQLDTVAARWSTAPDTARRGLDLARNMARHCMGEARTAVQDLRSQSLDRGDAVQALRQMALEFGAAGTPEIHVEVQGDPCPLPRNVEMTLLRIGQEALTNAIKHAHATRIDLEVDFALADVGLRVCDDGVGFAAESSMITAASGHFGLLGMRERANKVGGKLMITSRRGSGTTIDFRVPQKN